MMPASVESDAVSSIPVATGGRDGREGSQGPWPPGAGGDEDLQRALEREVVEQLHQENQRLKRCIEELKKKSDGGSWAEVSQQGVPDPTTPREIRQGEMEKGNRYTPGGTKVPPGPPAEDGNEDVRLPAWPPLLEGVYYETQPVKSSVKSSVKASMGMEELRMNRAPRHQQGEVMSPLEARAMWLERETVALRKAMQEQQDQMGKRCFYEALLPEAPNKERSG